MAGGSITKGEAKNLIRQTVLEFRERVMIPLHNNRDGFIRAGDTRRLKLIDRCPAFLNAAGNLEAVSDSILELDALQVTQLLSLCRDVSGLYALPVHAKIHEVEVGEAEEELVIPLRLPITCSYRFSLNRLLVTLDLDDSSLRGNSSNDVILIDDGASDPQDSTMTDSELRAEILNSLIPENIEINNSNALGKAWGFLLRQFIHNLGNSRHFDNLKNSVLEQEIQLGDLGNAVLGPAFELTAGFLRTWHREGRRGIAREERRQEQADRAETERLLQRIEEGANIEWSPEDSTQSNRESNFQGYTFFNPRRSGLGARADIQNTTLDANVSVAYNPTLENIQNLIQNLGNSNYWKEVFEHVAIDFGVANNFASARAGASFSFTGQIDSWANARLYLDPNRKLAFAIGFNRLFVQPSVSKNVSFNLPLRNSRLFAGLNIQQALGNALLPHRFDIEISIKTNLRNFWGWWEEKRR